MELIVAILIELGALTSPADFNQGYINGHQTEISKAATIIDNEQYVERSGGVTIDPGIGL